MSDPKAPVPAPTPSAVALPVVPPVVPPVAQAASRPAVKRPLLTAVMVASVIGGIGSFVVVAITRSAAAPPQAAPSTATTFPAEASRPLTAAPASEQPRQDEPPARWIRTQQRDWRRNKPDGVTFQLAAVHDVAVWNKRVRPVLTVRCVAGTSDVFVATYSASSFEPDAGLHTVRLAFDDRAAIEQKWEDSVDHEALFSPDGAAAAGRIAKARKMSFRFTPFNASPAVVDFAVAGLGPQLAAAAKSCGWRP